MFGLSRVGDNRRGKNTDRNLIEIFQQSEIGTLAVSSCQSQLHFLWTAPTPNINTIPIHEYRAPTHSFWM